MRCPSCSKFVSFGEPDVEVESSEVGDDDTVTAEVRVTLPCAECGEELKERFFTVDGQIDHLCEFPLVIAKLTKEAGGDPAKVGTDEVDTAVADREFDILEATAEPLDRMQGKSKRFYGATVTWEVVCGACDTPITVTADDEEEAAAFDSVA